MPPGVPGGGCLQASQDLAAVAYPVGHVEACLSALPVVVAQAVQVASAEQQVAASVHLWRSLQQPEPVALQVVVLRADLAYQVVASVVHGALAAVLEGVAACAEAAMVKA